MAYKGIGRHDRTKQIVLLDRLPLLLLHYLSCTYSSWRSLLLFWSTDCSCCQSLDPSFEFCTVYFDSAWGAWRKRKSATQNGDKSGAMVEEGKFHTIFDNKISCFSVAESGCCFAISLPSLQSTVDLWVCCLWRQRPKGQSSWQLDYCPSWGQPAAQGHRTMWHNSPELSALPLSHYHRHSGLVLG